MLGESGSTQMLGECSLSLLHLKINNHFISTTSPSLCITQNIPSCFFSLRSTYLMVRNQHQIFSEVNKILAVLHSKADDSSSGHVHHTFTVKNVFSVSYQTLSQSSFAKRETSSEWGSNFPKVVDVNSPCNQSLSTPLVMLPSASISSHASLEGPYRSSSSILGIMPGTE